MIRLQVSIPEEFRGQVYLNPQYIEKKTRRVQLVLRPSVYERIKTAAEEADTSVNDYIDAAMDTLLRQKDLINGRVK